MNEKKISSVLAASLFILILGLFSYYNVFAWFPTVVFATGISLVIRQLLEKCFVDTVFLLLLFGALFFFSLVEFFSRLFLPTFLIIGAFYYLLRQFFDFNQPLEEKHK